MDKSKAKRTRRFRAKTNGANDLEALWEKHGPTAIETVRKADPGAYIAAIARLVDDLG